MTENNVNPAWVKQPDGTYIPSKALVDEVRANRQNYPDAVKDFAILSGKSEEEVANILDNEWRSGDAWDYLSPDWAEGVGQGLKNAAGWAVENTGNLLDIEGLDETAEWIRQESVFETEKGTAEKIGEVVGQAASGIAAGIGATVATGGTGAVAFLTGMATGGAVSTATFNPEDETLISLIDEYVMETGPLQDILEITEEDSTASAMAKQFVAGAVVEAATAGLFKVAGKLGRALKAGKVEEAVEIAKEAGLKVSKSSDPMAPKTPREAAEVKPEQLDKILGKDAKETVQRALDEDTAGTSLPMLPVTEESLKAFSDRTLEWTRKYIARERGTTDLSHVDASVVRGFDEMSREVYTAIRGGDMEKVYELARRGPEVPEGADTTTKAAADVFHSSLVRAALTRTMDGFDELVLAIRADPSIKTRAAIRKLALDTLYQNDGLADIYRTLGSKASYELNARKGVPEGAVELGEMEQASKQLAEELKAEGINLFDGREKFISKKIIALDDAGINPADLIEELSAQFDEYSKFRSGKIANSEARGSMSVAEKSGWMHEFTQRLKDVQSVMLLGQFMTTMTEVISTGTHLLTTPLAQKLGGQAGNKWVKEYIGYSHAFGIARSIGKKAFVTGKGVLDDFDIKEGTNASALQYENIANPALRHSWRIMKMAVDLSIASSEFLKATRGYGIAYADGLEQALASGMTKKQAQSAAQEYASKRFSAEGAFLDEDLRIRSADVAFQNVFDGSTLAGKLGQRVEEIRNSDAMGGWVSVVARGALPFFRTLANIGGAGAQHIMPPGTASILKRIYPEGTHLAKFLDDFTGKNGEIARQVALGRQRMGMSLVASGFALTQIPGVEITGPSRGGRWGAKARSFEEYPPSSLIVGNKAFDLSRMLPFSAPLMLVGVLRDYQLEDALRMQGGDYEPTDGNLEWLLKYSQAVATTTGLLLQDAGAARGVFDFSDGIASALQEGDFSALERFGQSYVQQFTPGPLRMTMRSSGKVQHEGYTFWERWKATAGLDTGWERLDFFGHPINYPLLKGVDPSNRRLLRLDDPAYREFAMLNKFENLALKLPKPDAVFGAALWKQIGIEDDGPMGTEIPSLTDMKTSKGENAWSFYREHVYKGRSVQTVQVGTSRYGDKVSIGKVEIRKGENFEAAMRRLIGTKSYGALTSDARKKVWSAVYGYFKKTAKDQLKKRLVVGPSHFSNGRYGSPIRGHSSLAEAHKAGKKLAAQVQTTRGNSLDELFAIQE